MEKFHCEKLCYRFNECIHNCNCDHYWSHTDWDEKCKYKELELFEKNNL